MSWFGIFSKKKTDFNLPKLDDSNDFLPSYSSAKAFRRKVKKFDSLLIDALSNQIYEDLSHDDIKGLALSNLYFKKYRQRKLKENEELSETYARVVQLFLNEYKDLDIVDELEEYYHENPYDIFRQYTILGRVREYVSSVVDIHRYRARKIAQENFNKTFSFFKELICLLKEEYINIDNIPPPISLEIAA